MQDYIKRQVAERARAWGEAKSLLDNAAAENRDLTGTEQEQYDRINADLDERTAVIDKMTRDMERETQAAEVRIPETVAPVSGWVRSQPAKKAFTPSHPNWRTPIKKPGMKSPPLTP